jgi:hypothetical protein
MPSRRPDSACGAKRVKLAHDGTLVSADKAHKDITMPRAHQIGDIRRDASGNHSVIRDIHRGEARIAKATPLPGGGFDLVPEKEATHGWLPLARYVRESTFVRRAA